MTGAAGTAPTGTGLAGAVATLAMALRRLITRDAEIEGLRVTVFGLRNHVSRDAVRDLVRQKANVTVAGKPGEVELLRRDLELLKTKVNLAPLDTISMPEIQLMTDSLRALGKLPHVVVCCCSGGDCTASVVVPVMQPTLSLHLAGNGAAGSGRSRPAFAARTLASLLNDPGLFDPARTLSRVRLGRRLFDVSRRDAIFDSRASRRQLGGADRSAPLSKSAHRPAAPIRQAVRPRSPQSLHQGDQV